MFYLRAWLQSREAINNAYDIDVAYHPVEDGLENIAASLLAQSPDILGFSCYNSDYETSMRTAAIVKEKSPSTTIVLGGPNMSDPLNEMRKNPFADVIVPFEGELPFGEYLAALASGSPLESVSGIAFRRGGEIVFTGHRNDAAPLENYPEVFTEEFVSSLSGVVIYQTSRGCKFNCSYCLSAGTKYREFPMPRVMAELGRLLDNPAVDYISLADLDISANIPRMVELLEFVASRNTRRIPFFAFISSMEGMLAHTDLMERACFLSKNLQELCVTLQSGNPGVLALSNRKWFTIEHLRARAPEILAKFPRAKVELILGLPGETPESQKASLLEIFRLGFRQFHLFEYLVNPGSDFYNRRAELGLQYTDETTYSLKSTPTFSERQLAETRAFAANFRVLMRILRPEDIPHLEKLGVDLIKTAESCPLHEAAIAAGAAAPPDSTSIRYLGGMHADIIDTLTNFIAAEFKIPPARAETLRQRLRVKFMEDAITETELMKRERRETGRALISAVMKQTVSQDTLEALGIEPARTQTETTLYILFNHRAGAAQIFTADDPAQCDLFFRHALEHKTAADVIAAAGPNNEKTVMRIIKLLRGRGFFPEDPLRELRITNTGDAQ